MSQAIIKKSWEELRESGLFVFINQFLHIFGWCIIMETDTDSKEILNVYPARVTFRGFGMTAQSEAYKKITKYMNENSEKLLEETNE